MDPFTDNLIRSYPTLSPADLHSMGKQASREYLHGGVSLNQAIVKIASGTPGMTVDQVKRVIEFANQSTFQSIFEKQASDKNVEFDIADPREIFRSLDVGARPAVVDVNSDYSSDPTKLAAKREPTDAELIEAFGMKEKLADFFPGGKADEKTDKDFDKKQLAMGQKVEMEHTDSPKKAREISRDHLEEFDDYYTRLKKMERQADKEKKAACPGGKIRSKGEGKGLGLGKKKGPMGVPKLAGDMPPFLQQDRPKKVKEIYSALKRDHPGMPAEMKARIAARQGKKGKQHQGPPYKAPITAEYNEKKAAFDELMGRTKQASEAQALLDWAGGMRSATRGAEKARMLSGAKGLAAAGLGTAALGTAAYLAGRKKASQPTIKQACAQIGQYDMANPYGELFRAKQRIEKVAQEARDAAWKNEQLIDASLQKVAHELKQHILEGENLGEAVHVMELVGGPEWTKVAMESVLPFLQGVIDTPATRAEMAAYEMTKAASPRPVNPDHSLVQAFAAFVKTANNQGPLNLSVQQTEEMQGALEKQISKVTR